jgi:hypothetical protein
MKRLIGFSWHKAALVGVDVSACESSDIYPLNRNRGPNYFFSISDTSETVTFMETLQTLLQKPIFKMCYLSQQDLH